MPTLRETAARWLAETHSAIVVEVIEARGSVPREIGTRMLVSRRECAGTVGGGHLEWKAIATARALLAQAHPTGGAGAQAHPQHRNEPHAEHYPLGPALGQCCGGAVTLAYATLSAATLTAWPPDTARFELQLYGAGHVGRAIVQALAPLPVRVLWIDERDQEFAAARPLIGPVRAQIETRCIDTLEAEVRHAVPGAYYLVLTHQHELDLRITEAILRRADFAYLGLIGSKTKRQRFVHRFEQRSISAEVIARMTCPIGVPGIEGKEPEVIAAAVVAQLLLQPRELRPCATQQSTQSPD